MGFSGYGVLQYGFTIKDHYNYILVSMWSVLTQWNVILRNNIITNISRTVSISETCGSNMSNIRLKRTYNSIRIITPWIISWNNWKY